MKQPLKKIYKKYQDNLLHNLNIDKICQNICTTLEESIEYGIEPTKYMARSIQFSINYTDNIIKGLDNIEYHFYDIIALINKKYNKFYTIYSIERSNNISCLLIEVKFHDDDIQSNKEFDDTESSRLTNGF